MRLQKLLQRWTRSLKETDAASTPDSAAATHDLTSGEPPQSRNALFDDLTLQAEIIHHLEWCALFNDHLSVEGQAGEDLVELASASRSRLGQWLDKVQQIPALNDPLLTELAREHEQFHAKARQALALARQGRMDMASTLLNTDFERSRARVLALLRQIQKG